jgi:hypothetical protein
MRYFLLGFTLLALLVISVAGFRGDHSRKPPIEVFPDMDRQMKLRPQEPNDFFENGISSQLPVEGTVARAKPIGDSAVLPFEESPITTGRLLGRTNYVEINPLPVSAAVLERGRERYGISCSPCHGDLADGKGITTKFGMAIVANLHDQRIVEMTDGELFDVVSNGRNLMSGYRANVKIEDRWAIIAYLRALQLTRIAGVDDVPESERANLN